MANKKRIDPTQDRIKEVYVYDDGRLTRRVPYPSGRQRRDESPSSGRRFLCIDGKAYGEHRLIYIYHYGEIPAGMVIDHIDRNPENNRIENLRVLDQRLNLRNCGVRKKKWLKLKGVTWCKSSKKFKAWIVEESGYRRYLGSYRDPLAAAEKWDEVAEELFGDYAITNRELGYLN